MTNTTAVKDTLLAIVELDCIPDTLIDRTAWIARKFDYQVHLVLFEPKCGAAQQIPHLKRSPANTTGHGAGADRTG